MRNKVRKWVRFSRREDQRKYLYKLVIIGCLAVTIPIVFAGWVYYMMSMERVRNAIVEESRSALLSTRDRAELVLQRIEEESLQLANDPSVNALFLSVGEGDEKSDILLRKDLLDKISVLKNMNRTVKEIFLYDPEDRLVISNEYGVIPLANYRYRNEIGQWQTEEYQAQWLSLPDRAGGGPDRFVFVRMLSAPAIRTTIIVLLILRLGNMADVGFEQILLMMNPLVISVAEVFDTYAYTVGILRGQITFGVAVGMFKGVVGLVLVLLSNYIVKKMGHEGIY